MLGAWVPDSVLSGEPPSPHLGEPLIRVTGACSDFAVVFGLFYLHGLVCYRISLSKTLPLGAMLRMK